MLIKGEHRRTIGLGKDGRSVWAIDQTRLPHKVEIAELRDCADAVSAIKNMLVRGAPLIGATAAYGLFLGALENPDDSHLQICAKNLLLSRPTAVNLRWAVERVMTLLSSIPLSERAEAARMEAALICDEDVEICRKIGDYGLEQIRATDAAKRGDRINLLTHCNAGWLATIDWGTATAPIYRAQQEGLDIHIWVDETRPRNQGAYLTAFELLEQKVPHTLIVDSAAGHLMQHGQVDLCIVGTDRTTRRGDVCNKIGTYLKALAASANKVPFYVALPSTTVDWTIQDGLREVPIEQRNEEEVSWIPGTTVDGEITRVKITADGTPCANFAFDVTPAHLVTALITERGTCPANEEALSAMFPEAAKPH